MCHNHHLFAISSTNIHYLHQNKPPTCCSSINETRQNEINWSRCALMSLSFCQHRKSFASKISHQDNSYLWIFNYHTGLTETETEIELPATAKSHNLTIIKNRYSLSSLEPQRCYIELKIALSSWIFQNHIELKNTVSTESERKRKQSYINLYIMSIYGERERDHYVMLPCFIIIFIIMTWLLIKY